MTLCGGVRGNPGSRLPLKGAPKPVMWPRLQLACPAIRHGSVRLCVSGSDFNPYLVFSLKRQKKKMYFSSDDSFHYFNY